MQEAQACTHAMAEWELLLVAACPLVVVLLPAALVARDLARQLEHLAARPALLALLVPHLLQVGCLDKVEAVAAVVPLARAVQAVLAVAALAAAVVVLHAVHTRQALVA